MPSGPADIDVLIVGAGPVGLLLANECARRGLSARIVETRAGAVRALQGARHLSEDARDLRHGRARRAVPRRGESGHAGSPWSRTAGSSRTCGSRPRRRRTRSSRWFPRTSPRDCSRRRCSEEGGAVEYETTFVSAEQRGDRVVATLDRDGRRSEVSAAFVVGCDGAHSAVRHLLNLPFEGAQYEDLFLLADVETNDALPADELQLCPSEFGPAAIFPMSATRRRIVATFDRQEGDAPSLELVRSILRQRAPEGIEARAMHLVELLSDPPPAGRRAARRPDVRRRRRRAHPQPVRRPGDEHGPGRRLEPRVEARSRAARPRRQQAAARQLHRRAAADHQGRHRDHGPDDPGHGHAESVRAGASRHDHPVLSHLTPFQHAFVQRLSGLGIAYEGSPIVEGGGERYFDDSLRGGEGIRSRFLLDGRRRRGSGDPRGRGPARRVVPRRPRAPHATRARHRARSAGRIRRLLDSPRRRGGARVRAVASRVDAPLKGLGRESLEGVLQRQPRGARVGVQAQEARDGGRGYPARRSRGNRYGAEAHEGQEVPPRDGCPRAPKAGQEAALDRAPR